MPNRKLHNAFAEAFGIDRKVANEVNRTMDLPSKWMGPSHRSRRHDLPYVVMLGLKMKSAQATQAGLLHIALDELSTKNAEARKLLRLMEVLF
jgi:hypothetical protein